MNNYKESALTAEQRQARLVFILERLAEGQTLKQIAPQVATIRGTPMKLHGMATFFYLAMQEHGCRNMANFLVYAMRKGWIR